MDESTTVSPQGEQANSSKNGKKKEEKLLARLVKKKLEDYMNRTKREQQFDPVGACRTTSRMHKYDFAYKVIEATTLEKRAKEKLKKEKGNKEKIQPNLVRNSRQMTRSMEAVSLSESVSKVLEEVPVRDLTTLHTQRGVLTKNKNKDVRYQGYTSHVGSVLNGKKYVDYYIDQGLNTGNPSLSARLRDLKMRERSPSSSTSYTYSSDSSFSTSSDRTPSPQPRDPQTECNRVSVAMDGGGKKEGIDKRINQENEEHSEVDKREKENEKAGTTDPTVETSRANFCEKPTQTSLTDTSQESSSLTEDSPSEQLSLNNEPDEKRPESAVKSDASVREDNICSELLAEQDDNSRAEDEYSEDFEEEELEVDEEVAEDLTEFGDLPKRGKSSLSVETYLSVEHAEEVREEE